jgi:uncharacterized protein YgiM (DUF1202 family)
MRVPHLLTLAVLTALPAWGQAWGQIQPAPATEMGGMPMLSPPPLTSGTTSTTAPAPVTTPLPAAPAAPATPATATPEVSTKPFVGTVAGTRVYVRSGPGQHYYELGQLSKGDTVQVLGTKEGWYIIAPPAGTFCLIAKELVDVDASGKLGTVNTPFVNVRAGSALHPASDYAVLGVIKQGTPLNLVGATQKYYKIVPPDSIAVYVSATLIKSAGEGALYTQPQLKLPAGTPPFGKDDVAITPGSATTAPASSSTAPGTVPEPITVNITPPSGSDQTPSTQPTVVSVAPKPAVQFNGDAYSTFSALNEKTQAEFIKPLMKRDLKPLAAGYEQLLGMSDIAPSVKQGSQARLDAINKMIAVQDQAAGAQNDIAKIQSQSKAIDEQFKATEERMAAAEEAAPYIAQGVLKTSSAVADKYVLVNPASGRVTAYVEPSTDLDIAKLLNTYVGVKGKTVHEADLDIDVIKVKTITMLQQP